MVPVYTESFYRPFFEYSMDAVLLTAPDGAVFAANPAACKLFGRTEDEICKAGRSELVDSASPQLKNMLDERSRTGKTRGELVFMRGDDTRFPGEVSSVQFSDPDGNIRTIIIIRDLSESKRAEQLQAQLLFEANKNAAEVEAILASQVDAILMYDLQMNVRRANPSFVQFYGFDPVGLNGRDLIQRVSCERLDGAPLVLEDQPTSRALQGEKIPNVLYRVKRGDGSTAVIETSSMPLYVDGAIIGSVTVWHDVTELKRAEEALIKSSEEIEDLYQHAPCGYHSLDRNGLIVRMNNTELEWLGYSPQEVIGKMRYTDFLTAVSLSIFQENFPGFMERGYVHNLEFELKRKDGTTFPVLISGTAVRDAAGRYVASRSTVFDLTERKKLERELERQAHIDPLTGLNTRGYFFELADQQLARSKRHDTPLSLLLLDLDKFKSINDTYGHPVGDATLQKLGEVFFHALREIDIIGRLGGEEFAALLPDTTIEQALQVAERLRSSIENAVVPLEDGAPLHFTASIGVSGFQAADTGIDVMLKRADVALYRAKNAGRNRVCSDTSSPGTQ